MPELKTQRLRMRLFTLADGHFLHRLMDNPAVFFWRDQPVDLAEAEELLAAKFANSGPGLGWWPVFENPGDPATRDESRDFVGQVCVQPLPDSDEVELGYHFLPEFWGKGYATEAATAVLSHFFSTTALDHVSAVVLPDNHRSCGVVRRLGFIHNGTRLHGKKPRMHHYFELTRSSFEARAAGPVAAGE